MSDMRPPSEVELKYALEIYGNCDLLTRIINEVSRLRVLCGRAAEYLESERPPDARLRKNSLQERLDKASKGEL